MIVEKLELILSANTSNLTNGISKAKGALSDLPKQTGKTTSGMLSAFSAFKGGMMALGLGGLFVGIGKTISKSIGGAIGRVDTMNNFRKVMGNLGIESQSTDASIKMLSDKLTGLPTTLDSATLSVQRLTASNGNIGASTEMFLAMNNAILAGGADMQIQQSALEQLSQAYLKGKPDMMEWRTLLTAMPAQLKQVAIAMGYASADQLGVALRSGEVSMNDFMLKLVELNKNGANGFKSFEEQARGATGGIQTSMMNVKTAITRGIADIINAIGQANIASFFNGITRAINATIPYIVGFVKVVVSAIGMLSGLFGGKATKNQSSQTKNIQKSAGALNNVKSSGIGASKGIDKAGRSAKKLKKELNGIAAFDEMNILNEAKTPDTSSSGAGGGGGIGDMGNIQPLNFDTSGILDGMEKVKSKADEVAEQLRSFMDGWDFAPLQASLKNLGEAMQILKKNAKEALGNFAELYLKPLSNFVVNKALPDFLNSISNAIKRVDFSKIQNSLSNFWKALEPFHEATFSGLQFIFDVFLDLSTVVVNNLIPGFLDLLSGALSVLTPILNDAKDALSWLWDSFLQPIANWAGSIVGDFLTKLGDALDWIGQHEMVISILEGLAIAIGLVTVAMNAGAIASAVLAGIMGVLNVVTGVFAGIMTVLTSPITLVVVAIGALIGIIIYLIKNWDDVSKKAKEVWEKIKETWELVAQWFDENVSTPIKEMFEKLWNKIKETFDKVHIWFSDKFTSAKNSILNAFEPVKNWFADTWNNIKNTFANVGSWFRNKFAEAKSAVINVFSPIENFFSNLWGKITGKFKSFGTSIGNAVSGAFKTVINALLRNTEKTLNVPIRSINSLLGVINKVPGISLPRLQTFSLPRMAKGGIVDKPTFAMVGEAGREAVVPLERNTEWIDKLANKINVASGGQLVNLVVKLGEETIFKKFVDFQKDKQFESNGDFVFA